MSADFAALLLLSFVAFAIGVGPMIADFNKTHATNPLWIPHPRFHVVWQCLVQLGVSSFALSLLWLWPSKLHTWMAVFLNYNWMVMFLVTALAMPLYGGALADENGIKPLEFNIGGKIHKIDTNVFGACILFILNTIAVYLLLR